MPNLRLHISEYDTLNSWKRTSASTNGTAVVAYTSSPTAVMSNVRTFAHSYSSVNIVLGRISGYQSAGIFLQIGICSSSDGYAVSRFTAESGGSRATPPS